MAAPPRYDLIPSSCVNNEVVRFNRQLKKRMKMYNNVKILETVLERDYFTKHGLHLNSSGEEQIALKLVAVVTSFSTRTKCPPFALSGRKLLRSHIKIET